MSRLRKPNMPVWMNTKPCIRRWDLTQWDAPRHSNASSRSIRHHVALLAQMKDGQQSRSSMSGFGASLKYRRSRILHISAQWGVNGFRKSCSEPFECALAGEGPLLADTVEKVRKSNSRETISRASITVSKDDSRYRLSVNHCFAPAAIAAAEQTFSTVSAHSGHRSLCSPGDPSAFKAAFATDAIFSAGLSPAADTKDPSCIRRASIPSFVSLTERMLCRRHRSP